ncbi:MAG TPA: hypothetical protein V6C86_06950 [Oculatellaceae cyanobacterium]
MLSSEITLPDRKQFLHIKQQVDWKNPFLVLNVDGSLDIIAGALGRKKIKDVELEDVLCQLPVADWPYGKVIAVQPCAARSTAPEAFAQEDKAIKNTWGHMREAVTKLGIQINLWPSS